MEISCDLLGELRGIIASISEYIYGEFLRVLSRFYRGVVLLCRYHLRMKFKDFGKVAETAILYLERHQIFEVEIVDMFLENLLEDHGFIEWINKQRYKKRIEAVLQDCQLLSQTAIAKQKKDLENSDDEKEE